MRIPFICGNWKLHKTISESLELATLVRNAVGPLRDVEVAVAPVFTALHAVARRLEGSAVAVAAQDCFWQNEGAFTGEVSARQLRDAGCAYVIVGHSERRHLFGELDEAVGLKTQAALQAGLRPIVCVGETERERDAGETFGRVKTQLTKALANVAVADGERITIAYEPVWAIGTGRTATPAQAEEVHAYLRNLLAEIFDAGLADKIRRQRRPSPRPAQHRRRPGWRRQPESG